MMTGDRHDEETIVCREASRRKSSITVQELQAVTDRPGLQLKWPSYSPVTTIGFLRSGGKAPPGSDIGFCRDMLMAG